MNCDYCGNESKDITYCVDCDAMLCFNCTIFDHDGDPYCPECFERSLKKFERRENEPDDDGFFGLG